MLPRDTQTTIPNLPAAVTLVRTGPAPASPDSSGTTKVSFVSLGLMPELMRAVADQGYQEPTPIQAKAIPAVLQRRDIMGCAQTGTGKTAGFTLPLLQLLAPFANTSLSPAKHPVRALIVTPTRELSAQVEESVRTYGKHLPLRSTVVFGGVDINPQMKALHAGVEILVATPGRLLDHLNQKNVNLSRVEILVLDEADRMLDMGFLPDIKRILATLPPQRQNLLFSATFPEEVRRLAAGLLRGPIMIEVAPRNTPAELVSHQVHLVSMPRKRALLAHLIRSHDMRQVLVFVRMKRDANRLARQLQHDGITAAAIHSDRTQAERMQALEEFKQGKVPVLVATDIAARGLDIEELPYVVNFELPHSPEDYLHRIGRTGRAGLPGEAISLVAPDELKFLEDIERLLKRKLPRAERAATDDARPAGPREHRAHPAPRHAPSRAPQARQHPPRSQPKFDFSKPYEPAPASETAATETPAASGRDRHKRPTAALLGGLRSKSERK